MKKRLLAALPLAATAAATLLTALPAAAQLSFNASAITDYRYRGVSQTRLKPALQGGADFAAGGLYVGAWASTIKWIKDAKGDADIEVDVYGGYKGEIVKGLGFDVGVLGYVYPSNKLKPSANTTEFYGALTLDTLTVKYSRSTTNLFGFADSKGSGYLDFSAAIDLGNGWSMTPHLGYQKVAKNSTYSYTDYSLTLGKDLGSGLSASAAVIGASVDKLNGTAVYASPSGKNLGRTGLVVGIKYSF